MAEDNRIILDYDEVADLDDKKLEEAKKKFQQVAYPLVRDVTPVVGEVQSYKYAMQDAETLAKAARGEEGYDDMTPIEALAYAGLTGLGVAGTIPLVGPIFRTAQKGIRALMPKRGSPTAGAQAQRSVAPPPTSIRQDPGFNYFVSQLPEYRRRPEGFADNYREYMNLDEATRATYTDIAAGQPAIGNRTLQESTDLVNQLTQTKQNQKKL